MSRQTGRDPEAFVEEAKRIFKAEMARRGFSFKRLAATLNALEDSDAESAQTLINKVNRGRFSFAFLLRATRAMGMSTVDVSQVRGEPVRDRTLTADCSC